MPSTYRPDPMVGPSEPVATASLCHEVLYDLLFSGLAPSESRIEALLDRVETGTRASDPPKDSP
ncbi:hypothetical protein [Jannaschia aquimarina]|uniref:Uncharacterized protein n=1 Tax=Jannaschia aquimarina TaxID=935700 RepID=A0A0D1EFE5_9RHOB|nr:hypothetical protein [Jannaschia aquimarina]KIT16329.1 hypothetical protein jaqu_19250 [Jannaschia aquimarina]SNT26094.1 hypothetical protein SAMN05421775_10960 [Jannaschia aquimarina]